MFGRANILLAQQRHQYNDGRHHSTRRRAVAILCRRRSLTFELIKYPATRHCSALFWLRRFLTCATFGVLARHVDPASLAHCRGDDINNLIGDLTSRTRKFRAHYTRCGGPFIGKLGSTCTGTAITSTHDAPTTGFSFARSAQMRFGCQHFRRTVVCVINLLFAPASFEANCSMLCCAGEDKRVG